MKLLVNTKNKITQKKNGENLSHLKITEVVLVYGNIVNKDSHYDKRVLHRFVPNKQFGQLLAISPRSSIFLKTLNS